MNWHRFIFSDEKWVRFWRHLLFWLLWWIYFTASYYHYQQVGLEKITFEPWNTPFFAKATLLLIIHMVACYYFINILIPKFLFTAKYKVLILHIFLLSFVILFLNYFLHKTVWPLINNAFHYRAIIKYHNVWWTSITSGILSVPKVIAAAAAAKLLKRWYMKQKEKEKLEKEKLITDLQLLKIQMHPELLFSSLNKIRLLAQKKDTGRASVLLLKLADILSYILYECDQKQVLLEKEINVIRDYLLLEKNIMGNRLEIDMAMKGKPGLKTISPLLLFSLIENCFSYIDNTKLERHWINIEFQMDANEFTMRMIHGKTAEHTIQVENNDFANAMKRLEYYYPGRYELKTTAEPEMMSTTLKMILEESADIENRPASELMAYAAV